MEKLLDFLRSNGHTLLFIIIEIVSLILLLDGSKYRRTLFCSTANIISGEVVEVSHVVNRYIGLKESNIELMARNAFLEKEVLRLKGHLDRISVDSLSWQRLALDTVERSFPYDYKVARVVGNTMFAQDNYITLDLGTDDGVAQDMGVVSSNGIVGVVEAVGRKYCKVLPLINNRLHVSCKVQGSEYVGALRWDGGDIEHSQLVNLPKHLHYSVGDSVFTSGYSSIFPEHLYVGQIIDAGVSADDNFFAFRVKLSTDFSTLKYVYILSHVEIEDRKKVESYDRRRKG